jgi:uncharacterized protein (DUF486 family)
VRQAEVQVSAERDRLNLIIYSVADPIIVTDAGGATSLMNVFGIFSVTFLGEAIRWNHIAAFCCLVGPAFFSFARWT